MTDSAQPLLEKSAKEVDALVYQIEDVILALTGAIAPRTIPGKQVALLRAEAERLASILHEREIHPDFEYATTHGPRKAFDCHPPEEDAGWEPNLPIGRDGWERFEYHEECYWRRRRQPTIPTGLLSQPTDTVTGNSQFHGLDRR